MFKTGLSICIPVFALAAIAATGAGKVKSAYGIKPGTREEVKKSILKKSQIADGVSFYHSNDRNIYSAYDWAMAGEKEGLNDAKNMILGILDAGEEADKQSRKMEISFFAREKFFKTIDILRRNGMFDPEMKAQVYRLLGRMSFAEERGPNNRAANFAIGALTAAEIFPDHPDVPKWKSYAESVWNDWFIPGDSYEPCYVAHNLPRLIALGIKLGKYQELKSEKLKKVYYRYRDHISPSGLAVTPGDGEPYDQISYVAALENVMKVCPDPTILWALKKAFLAGTIKSGPLPEPEFAGKYPQYAGMKEQIPDNTAQVQEVFPATYRQKDRLLLHSKRTPGKPFAMFYIQDDCNYLYHGGISDTRGDLTHYEADGVLLIAHRGRYEWPAWNNTFLLSEPDAQYPFRQTSGVHAFRTYASSANLRVARAYLPSENYLIKNRNNSAHFGFYEKKNPQGYMWGNPDAPAGKNDQLKLRTVRLKFALIPEAGEKSVGKIFPGRTWFGGYEYRNVCPSDVPVEVEISDLFIAGKKGKKVIVPFDRIDENIKFTFTAPDAKQKFPEVPLDKENYSIVTDPVSGKKSLRLKTFHGITNVEVKVNEDFDLTEDYSRIGLTWKYVTPIRNWVRVPIAIDINGSPVQNNLRLDRQQGGIITEAKAETRGEDSYGLVSYRSIWTHDSSWTREALLTNEGILLVLDRFQPGKAAAGKVGGPVWHLPSSPGCGPGNGAAAEWFDSSIRHDPPNTRSYTDKFGEGTRRLFIAFSSPRGSENGIQYQPKHWFSDDFAVYSKTGFEAGKEAVFLSVLIPHSAETSGASIAKNLKIKHDDGNFNIRYVFDKNKTINITMSGDGKWKVVRQQK